MTDRICHCGDELHRLRTRVADLEGERNQLRLDMMEKHKIAKNLINRHNAETCRFVAEIEAWKDATGLDPDDVTPDDLREEIAHLRTTQEKSWCAVGEAICARYEVVIRDLMDACDRMMGDSDLPDDESFEIKAMRRAAAVLKGGA